MVKKFGERVIHVSRHRYQVGGFHKDSTTVSEFLAYVFHGSNCYKNDFFSIFGGKTMRSSRTEVYNRKVQLEDEGYKAILMWQCEWNELIKNEPEIIAHLSEIDDKLKLCKDPIEPRHALLGGRTEATAVYAKADLSKDESIKGVDFTSLYPAVMKQDEFPTSHPSVLGVRLLILIIRHIDISVFFALYSLFGGDELFFSLFAFSFQKKFCRYLVYA